MSSPIADAEHDDKPLDPAVERVRRKLVRFAVINLLILLLAILAVAGALIWRTGARDKGPPAGGFVDAPLALPAGAQVLSHTVSDRDISLLARLVDGSEAVLVFGRADGALVGRHVLQRAP